jgi:hypothetical protein
MPAFTKLTADELAASVLYERVAFGGQDLAAALVDCTSDLTEATASGE